MAINNWLVNTKQIKQKQFGLFRHFTYLFDKNRPAHYYSKIYDLNKSSEKLSNIIHQHEVRKNKRKEKKLRGGGVSNLATSFVLAIPRDINQPKNVSEWQRIVKITLQELSEKTQISFDNIIEHSVIVLHEESKSRDKPNHVHILVGNIIDGQVQKSLSQFRATNAMKSGFNRAVKEVLGEDHRTYTPKKKNVGKKPLFIAREEKLNALELEIRAKEEELKPDIKPRQKTLQEEHEDQEKELIAELRREINKPSLKPTIFENKKKKNDRPRI